MHFKIVCVQKSFFSLVFSLPSILILLMGINSSYFPPIYGACFFFNPNVHRGQQLVGCLLEVSQTCRDCFDASVPLCSLKGCETKWRGTLIGDMALFVIITSLFSSLYKLVGPLFLVVMLYLMIPKSQL